MTATLACLACGDSVLVARELRPEVTVSNLEPANAGSADSGPPGGKGYPSPAFPFKGKPIPQHRATRQNENAHEHRGFVDHDDDGQHANGSDAGSSNHD